MAWLDERKPASFRGLAFEAVELSESGGNVLVVDKIPESDDHVVGELGNEVDRFHIVGWVTGDDYLDQIGNLKAAFKKRGVGELVHPWRGQMLGRVERWTFPNDIGGGLGEFEFDFVPAGIETRPTVLIVTETDIIEKQTSARAVMTRAQPAQQSLIASLPGYLRDAVAVVQAREATELIAALGLATDSPEASALRAIDGDFDAAADVFEAVDNAQTLLRYLSSAGATLVGASSTPSGEAAATATQAGAGQYRVLAVSRLAVLASVGVYPSADAAEQTQALVTAQIDALLDASPSDDLWTVLADLRSSLVASLSEIASRLPREVDRKVLAPRPALVLAFDLYGSVTREQQILDLNRSQHPGFLVGDITVLSS